MKRTALLAFMLYSLTPALFSSQNFDQRVSEARRHMRAACQVIQKISQAPGDQRLVLKNLSAKESAEAASMWSNLTKDFSKTIPDGYAGDPGWRQRLEDIRLNITRMRSEILAEEFRPAFLSCAHACNLITMMHAANGVQLAIDSMAVLRKKIKITRGLLAAHQYAKALKSTREVLAARDNVLMSPPPQSEFQEKFLAKIADLSRSIDAVALASGNASDLKTALDQAAEIVEHVYELAL